MMLDLKIISILKYFCNKYKSDIIAVALIIVYFSLFTSLMWGYFGSILYDCGREAYLPKLILEGKILFKDIFAMYNPLSYQINAGLYLLFGKSLDVLFYAGAINALVILLISYFILRQFIKPKISVLTVFFLMFMIILNSFHGSNYIFPYAYAMVYALTFFFASILFCCLYIKNPKNIYNIILSFLMLGLSFANKPEFILCIFPLFWILFRQKVRYIYILAILIFILPTILSYGIMFLQGVTLHDLSNYIVFIKDFFNTPEQHFFNLMVAQPFNFKTIISVFIDFIKIISIGGLPMLIFKLSKTKNYYKYLVFPLCILVLYLYSKLAIVYSHDYIYLSWCCLADFFILYFAIRTRNDILVFLASCAIISCYRLHFILKGPYCIYMIILPFLVCVIYFIKYLNIKFIKYKDKLIASIFLVIFSLFVFINYYHTKYMQWIKADTYGHGTLYNFAYVVEPFNETLDWIIKNTKTEDTVVVLPEGLLINYFTDRKTNPKYYHLIPNHISALGEDYIVNDLRNNLPDYFVLNNTSYHMYGTSFICGNFGFEICNLIFQNYELQQQFRSKDLNFYGKNMPYLYVIYKLKDKQKI